MERGREHHGRARWDCRAGSGRWVVVETALGAALSIAAGPHAHIHGVDGLLVLCPSERVTGEQLAQGLSVYSPMLQCGVEEAAPSATMGRLETQVDRRRYGLGGEEGVGEFEEGVGPAVETLVERVAERAKGVKSVESFHDATIMHSPAASRTFRPPARLKRKLKVLLRRLRSTSNLHTIRYYKVIGRGVEARNFVLTMGTWGGGSQWCNRLCSAIHERRGVVSSSELVRWGGLAAMGAGALYILAEFMDLYNFVLAGGGEQLSDVMATAPYAVEALLLLLGDVLLLFGLFGLYVRQSEAAGTLGLVGFLVAFLGTALTVGVDWDEVFVVPILADAAPELLDAGPPLGIILSFLTFLVGWLMFGVAALRARVYPRWAALLLIVGAVLAGVPLSLSTVPFGIAVAWMGSTLFAGRNTSAEQPARVR